MSDHHKSHETSEGHEEFETLEQQLKRLGVEGEDLADLKRIWNLT